MQTLTWGSVQLWAGTLPECRSYPHSVMETALGITPLSLNSRHLAFLVGTHALPVVGTLVFPVVGMARWASHAKRLAWPLLAGMHPRLLWFRQGVRHHLHDAFPSVWPSSSSIAINPEVRCLEKSIKGVFFTVPLVVAIKIN